MFAACSLVYHDVVGAENPDESGFPGKNAERYKLDIAEFERHVKALSELTDARVALVTDSHKKVDRRRLPVLLTFDDGGLSAYTHTADILEKYGCRGHFLITTDFIGRPAFMTEAQIAELGSRGHVIGSHSCSHPDEMPSCDREELEKEWGDSRKILEDILGDKVRTASLPGGYNSEDVMKAAAAVGIEFMFTSEPTVESWIVDGCMVLGRYCVMSSMKHTEVRQLASGRLYPRLKQSTVWKLKATAKSVSNPLYTKLRKLVVKRPDDYRSGI